jgi:glycerophosphoryl diester phosphodiesterase
MKAFANGISPENTAIATHADAHKRAQQMGMLVTPYTFRASAVKGYPDVRAEMADYLERLDVNGVITDNPDRRSPRR